MEAAIEQVAADSTAMLHFSSHSDTAHHTTTPQTTASSNTHCSLLMRSAIQGLQCWCEDRNENKQ